MPEVMTVRKIRANGAVYRPDFEPANSAQSTRIKPEKIGERHGFDS